MTLAAPALLADRPGSARSLTSTLLMLLATFAAIAVIVVATTQSAVSSTTSRPAGVPPLAVTQLAAP